MLKLNDLPTRIRQINFHLPEGYNKVFELNLTNLGPWRFLTGDEFLGIYEAIKEVYPESEFVPFARRKDNDDVACFVAKSEKYSSRQIAVIHLFASPEYAIDAAYDGFWDWFRVAIDEMIEMAEAV